MYIDELKALIESLGKKRYNYDVEVRYSNAYEFLKAVQLPENKFPYYNGDFFPYLSKETKRSSENREVEVIDHWSGYYSTKPELKQHIRDSFKHFRALNKFVAFIKLAEASRHSDLLK